jgi:ElaB/YqjD/DUF883 family membrane-anchored ribosome-binding protein
VPSWHRQSLVSTLVAQALLEKGLLESALAGMSSAVDATATVIREQPWLCAALVAVVCLFILSRRK